MKSKDIYTSINESIKLDGKIGFMSGFMHDGYFEHVRKAMEVYAKEIAINTVSKYLGMNASVLYEEYNTGEEDAKNII